LAILTISINCDNYKEEFSKRVQEMVNNDSKHLVYSVLEAGKRLGLSRGLMYEAIRTGQIPSVRIGRRIIISCAALDRLLEGNQTDSTHSNS